MKDTVKVKVTAFIGPNTVVGTSGNKTVRARVSPSNRPAVGAEVELPESEVSKATEAECDKADAVVEQSKAVKKAEASAVPVAPGAVPLASSSPSKK